MCNNIPLKLATEFFSVHLHEISPVLILRCFLYLRLSSIIHSIPQFVTVFMNIIVYLFKLLNLQVMINAVLSTLAPTIAVTFNLAHGYIQHTIFSPVQRHLYR